MSSFSKKKRILLCRKKNRRTYKSAKTVQYTIHFSKNIKSLTNFIFQNASEVLNIIITEIEII